MAHAADFKTLGGNEIGMRLVTRPDGTGELELHCDVATPQGDQVLFAKYVDGHLRATATGVTRLRTYICSVCSTPARTAHSPEATS